MNYYQAADEYDLDKSIYHTVYIIKVLVKTIKTHDNHED